MVKVFYNNSSICFRSKDNSTDFENFQKVWEDGANIKVKEILKTVEENDGKDFLILCSRPKELLEYFKVYLNVINAGGGLVKNSKDQILFIYRLNKWDLPKGKANKNENIEDAALREVIEETGIDSAKIIRQLTKTYHIYKLNNKRILKISHWFEMSTGFKGELKPQASENITDAKWVDKKEFPLILSNSYGTIKELINFYY